MTREDKLQYAVSMQELAETKFLQSVTFRGLGWLDAASAYQRESSLYYYIARVMVSRLNEDTEISSTGRLVARSEPNVQNIPGSLADMFDKLQELGKFGRVYGTPYKSSVTGRFSAQAPNEVKSPTGENK